MGDGAEHQRSLASSRRGRPRKFNRRSRAVTLTLPEETIETLSQIDNDIGRAIVRLVQPLIVRKPVRLVEVVTYGTRAVIVVPPTQTIAKRTGAKLIPLTDGRALISFTGETSISEIELEIGDALGDPSLVGHNRALFQEIEEILKDSRRANDVRVQQHAIVVFEHTRSVIGT